MNTLTLLYTFLKINIDIFRIRLYKRTGKNIQVCLSVNQISVENVLENQNLKHLFYRDQEFVRLHPS